MNQPKYRSLQAKTSARIAAVQLAYRAKMRGTSMVPETLISEYQKFREEDSPMKGEAPNKTLLEKLLQGLAVDGAALEKLAEEQLKSNWSPERVSPILLAILKLAIFEMDAHRSLKEIVIIDEYTNIAAKFLDADEVDFVHATLKKLAGNLR